MEGRRSMDTDRLAPRNPKLTNVPVAQIALTDKRLRSRVKMDDHRITAYAEAIGRGEDLFETVAGPVRLFHDGTTYWIGDGWHRVSAALRHHQTSIPARVTTGGKAEAIAVAELLSLRDAIAVARQAAHCREGG